MQSSMERETNLKTLKLCRNKQKADAFDGKKLPRVLARGRESRAPVSQKRDTESTLPDKKSSQGH